MICPKCGHTEKTELDNSHNPERTIIGSCTVCGTDVYEGGTTRSGEPKKITTVREGEEYETEYADFALQVLGGDVHEDRGRFADIDRNVYDIGGSLLYALEIKTRTCTMNGYKETKFPYRKIEKAQQIVKEKDIPVHIILVFTDGIGKITIYDEDSSFKKGNENFVPNYRNQTEQTQQKPVEYHVEKLDVLPIDE